MIMYNSLEVNMNDFLNSSLLEWYINRNTTKLGNYYV